MADDDEHVKTPSPPLPLTISSTSPFFLSPQDRPGDFITPTRLLADNYDQCASDMQTALEARRKFVFPDGSITSPTPPCTPSDWSTIQAMLISWIMNTISPEIKGTLSKYRDAKRLRDSLFLFNPVLLWLMDPEFNNLPPLLLHVLNLNL